MSLLLVSNTVYGLGAIFCLTGRILLTYLLDRDSGTLSHEWARRFDMQLSA